MAPCMSRLTAYDLRLRDKFIGILFNGHLAYVVRPKEQPSFDKI